MISRRRTDVVGILIYTALDAGINFIPTADVYSAGASEEVVGKAPAAGERDDVVLATPAERRLERPPSHVPPPADRAARCGSVSTEGVIGCGCDPGRWPPGSRRTTSSSASIV